MFGSKTMTGLEKHVNRVCMNVSGINTAYNKDQKQYSV